MSVIEECVAFVAEATWADVPLETRRHLITLLGDGLIVAAAGSRAPGCEQLIGLASEWEVSRGASVFFQSMSLPPADAAMVNATLIEAWDYDDTHDAGLVHTVAPILPSLLAVSEWRSRPGQTEDFLCACAVGIELLCRLGSACVTPLSWTRTATLGGIAGAAGASKFLGLDAGGINDAMGIAYTQAAGNSQTIVDSATSKKLQVGFASRAAVLASQLASLGLTGPRDIFEGKYGYFAMYEPDAARLSRAFINVGTDWFLNEVCVKPYPCARDTHAAVAAALSAVGQRRLDAEEVRSVQVITPRLAADVAGRPVDVRGPQAAVAAILSIPYTVSVAITEGAIRIHDLDEQAIMSPDRQLVQRKVAVDIDERAAANELAPVTVLIKLHDGELLEGHCDVLPGGSSWIETHAEAMAAKRDDCLAVAEAADASARWARLENLLTLNEGVSDLPAALSAALGG